MLERTQCEEEGTVFLPVPVEASQDVDRQVLCTLAHDEGTLPFLTLFFLFRLLCAPERFLQAFPIGQVCAQGRTEGLRFQRMLQAVICDV